MDKLINYFQEVVDNLRDIQESMDTRDKNSQTLKLDYTLSLTDPSMMEKCLSDLKKIENLQDRHCFRDISKNAQFGVMRILRKYCQKGIIHYLYTCVMHDNQKIHLHFQNTDTG